MHNTVVPLADREFAEIPRCDPIQFRADTRLKIALARTGLPCLFRFARGDWTFRPCSPPGATYVKGKTGLASRGRPFAGPAIFLPVPNIVRVLAAHWRIDERIVPPYSNAPVIRVVRGVQAGEFGPEFFSARYTVTPQADRMGARLRGAALVRGRTADLVSSAVVPGTVQIPPDGQPIVLLADAQTLGVIRKWPTNLVDSPLCSS